MTKTMPATTTTIETLIFALSHFNSFKVTHTSSDPRIPKTFMCNSIEVIDIPDWHASELIFNRRFLSPIKFSAKVISITNHFSDAHSATFTIHMQDGDSDIANRIEVVASHDTSIFIPIEPCQMNDSHLNSGTMIDYLMNPDFYDPNKICHQDGLYVIDPNRLGIMTKRQEYIFESFMRLELERECYHDVLKTVCFVVKDWEVSVGLYNLECDVIEEMHEMKTAFSNPFIKLFNR